MENNFSDIVVHHSDEELLSMVYQFTQWDAEMLVAVEDELKQRNILPEDILIKKNTLIQKKDEFWSEGKEATFPQQFLGWIGVFGILGLIIGNHLAFAKTISKYTGKEYFKYDEASRESGRYMYYISLTIIIAFFLYKIANYIERN
ncbi:MAG: hypothetical protein LH615_12655 [Ferruginibacter sp.]|nr:hypothetical protein [Ferruginibacter sp.]